MSLNEPQLVPRSDMKYQSLDSLLQPSVATLTWVFRSLEFSCITTYSFVAQVHPGVGAEIT